MDCLEDWILVKTCATTTPDSGVYLEDLYGVSLRQIDEIANEDQVNFTGVWADIQKRALNRFKTDVISGLKKRYLLKTLTSNVSIGKNVLQTTETASASEYRGLRIELNDENDDYVYSNLHRIYIQNVQINLKSAVNADIKFYDLDTGTLLLTKTYTGVQGWQSINVNQYFDVRRLFVGYDASLADSIDTDINKIRSYSETICCGLEIDGASSTQADPTTLTLGNNTFGLIINCAAVCGYEALVCNNKDLFTQSLLYLLGIELMNERIYSDRLSRYTTIDLRQAELLRQEFMSRYKGGQVDNGTVILSFDGELPTALDGIQLNQNDCCIECNDTIMFKDANL